MLTGSGRSPATKARANIPPKRNRKELLQPLICIGRVIWLNGSSTRSMQFRRIATRYDKLDANYLAFYKLASVRIWLRADEVHDLAITTEGDLPQACHKLRGDQDGQSRIPAGSGGSLFCGKFHRIHRFVSIIFS
jgi:hypothetical protein